MKNFPKRLHNASFTLMELIVVLAIIVVMSSMGIPSLRQTLARAEFREGTVMLQTELQKTRLLAMKTGVPYVFHFQKGTGIYQILSKEDYIKIYQQKNNDTAGLGGYSSGTLGGALSQEDNGGEDPFDGSARFEEAESNSDNLNEVNQADFSSGFNPDRSAPHSSDTSPGESRFSGSLDVPSDESFAGQNNGSINSMIQAGNDFDSPGTISEGSLPNAVRELPGRVQFDGITISAATPSGFDTPSEGSGSPLEMGGSQFSGTLGTPSGPVSAGPSSETGYSVPSDQMSTNSAPSPLTDGLTSSEIPPQAIWGEPILFYSNGRTSHAVIHLKSSSGENFWHSEVALRGLTGAARINYIENR